MLEVEADNAALVGNLGDIIGLIGHSVRAFRLFMVPLVVLCSFGAKFAAFWAVLVPGFMQVNKNLI